MRRSGKRGLVEKRQRGVDWIRGYLQRSGPTKAELRQLADTVAAKLAIRKVPAARRSKLSKV
jgi:hypothetical protein